MMTPYDRTKDNYELHFGINHPGHFALTGLLLDVLKNSTEARIITMSSVVGDLFGKINLEDPNWENRKYKRLRAYGQSKLANLMFAYELQRKLEKNENGNGITNIKSIGSHLGWSTTNLQKNVWYLRFGNKFIGQKAKKGALTMLYAAIADDIEGGEYIVPKRWLRGFPKKIIPKKLSKKEEITKGFWEISEELTKVKYDFS